MPIAIPAARQKLIERIATTSRRMRKRADPLPADSFIRQYYHGVAEEDLAEYRSEELAAAALAHLRFASVRKPAQPLVRIYNAEEARDGWTSRHTSRRSDGRRHAVPGRLTRHGADASGSNDPHDGAPGARRAPRSSRAHRRARRGRSHQRSVPPRVVATDPDRPHRRRAARARAGAEAPAYVERRAGSRGRLAGDASARRRSRAGDNSPPAADRQQRSPRDQGAARVDGRQPLHLSGLSPVSPAPRPRRGHPRAAAGDRPGHPARAARHPGRADHADGPGPRACAQAGPADDHQGELDVDRASRDVSRLRRAEDVRQHRPGHRRETLPRAVHFRGLQPQPARDSAVAAQDRQHGRALRPRSRQPRRQGRHTRAGDIPARRAVPGERVRAHPHRARHRQLVRASPRARVPAPRRVRPLLFRAHLRAARPLQHAGPPAHGVDHHPASARNDHRVAGAAVGFGAGARAHDHPRASRQLGIRSIRTRSSA